MYCNNASYFSSILVQTWIWQDLSTSRIVRVEILCVLHVHFDLEGARHADLENKHDLVIRFHYKLMFALKKKTKKTTFVFVLQHIRVFFPPEPFMSTLSVQQETAVSGKSWDCCSFPSVESLQ